MLGHEITLTRTNSGGVVWVCECGAIGDVVPLIGATKEVTARSRRRIELTEGIARARHGGHLEAVREDVVRRGERALAQIGRNITAANATLQRRGRWGRP